MKIIEKTFDITTNQETIIERDETAAETKIRIDAKNMQEIIQKKAEIDTIEKAALLVKLDITADEAKLLLS